MTDGIAKAARRYASRDTEIVALKPHFGAEAVDCNFESYLSAVAVMDRVVTYSEPFDAMVMAIESPPRQHRHHHTIKNAHDRQQRALRAL